MDRKLQEILSMSTKENIFIFPASFTSEILLLWLPVKHTTTGWR